MTLPSGVALSACAATDVVPSSGREAIARVLARPLDGGLACFTHALAAEATVAGIRPTTVTVPLERGVRVEQSSITKDAHQCVTYERRALVPTETSIVIALPQQRGQYAQAGFVDAARAAAKGCV